MMRSGPLPPAPSRKGRGSAVPPPPPLAGGGWGEGASPLARLAADIRACRTCAAHLPREPRPVFRASTTARLLIAGQAPGTKVHETGIPWNDPSGDRLRA